MSSKRTAPDPIAMEREVQACNLYRELRSYEDVAQVMGINRGVAFRIIQRAMLRGVKGASAELREHDIERRESLVGALWATAHGEPRDDEDDRPSLLDQARASQTIGRHLAALALLRGTNAPTEVIITEDPQARADRLAERLETYLAGAQDQAAVERDRNGSSNNGSNGHG